MRVKIADSVGAPRTVEVAPVPGGVSHEHSGNPTAESPPPWFVHTAWRAHRALGSARAVGLCSCPSLRQHR